jgi:DNA-directed RNA polymerase subunit M/transcription elongation factor TFIIS
MDSYSLKTLRLLLERDREYLVTILKRYSNNVPDTSELTEADAIRIILSVSHGIDCNDNIITTESSIYVCVCGSKHIATIDRQIRSADEGSSIQCVCRKCGNTWIAK